MAACQASPPPGTRLHRRQALQQRLRLQGARCESGERVVVVNLYEPGRSAAATPDGAPATARLDVILATAAQLRQHRPRLEQPPGVVVLRRESRLAPLRGACCVQRGVAYYV